jgi:ABC-type uncharacterized transport system fused permease/ATPase subunit
VRINTWNNPFYNALKAFNSGELFRQLGSFCILVVAINAVSRRGGSLQCSRR